AFSADSQRLATASLDKTARLWDAQSGQELLTLKGHTGAVYSVAFSPDGQRLATASLDKTARLWDARSGQELLSLQGHADGVVGVAFSPDGQRLETWGSSNRVIVFDLATGRPLPDAQLTARPGQRLSPDGRYFAQVEDAVVYLHDLRQPLE